MNVKTSRDGFEFIKAAIENSGEKVSDYNVTAIADNLHRRFETWDFDMIPAEVFWAEVERGER